MEKNLNVLSCAEMRKITGGDTYNLIRTQKNADGSFTVFTFSTDNAKLAEGWLGFWNAAGWVTVGTVVPDPP